MKRSATARRPSPHRPVAWPTYVRSPMTQSYSDEVRETVAIEGQVIMPFYLIIDVSGSMSGDEQKLTFAIDDLIQTIRKDPVVDDLVMLSIITFNHAAQSVVPLGSP